MADGEPKPWYIQRTVWAAAAAVVAGLGTIVGVLLKGYATEITSITAALTGMIASLAAIFARAGGKDDAVKITTQMLEQHTAETGTPTVLPPKEVAK